MDSNYLLSQMELSPPDLDELLVVLPGLLLVVDEVISLTRREGGRGFSGTGWLWESNTRESNHNFYTGALIREGGLI